jgi:hypothetical protein
MGEKRNACRILVGTQKERYHQKDLGVGRWIITSIKMDLREIGGGGVDWIDLA